MNWLIVERCGSKPGGDWEHVLYQTISERQIALPSYVCGADGRVIIPEPRPRFSILHLSILPDISDLRWKKRRCPTQAEYDAFVDKVVAFAPAHAQEIRALVPGSEIGHLMLTRIAPACPDIEESGAEYLVREPLKRKLENVPGISLFPAYIKKAVPLDWELGQSVPRKVMRSEEPESVLLRGKHSPELAAAMGNFYEVELPPRQKWHHLDASPPGKTVTRVAIPASQSEECQEVLVEDFGKFPWFLVTYGGPRDPEQNEIPNSYDFVREDVCDILREPGKWTLEFREVEFP